MSRRHRAKIRSKWRAPKTEGRYYYMNRRVLKTLTWQRGSIRIRDLSIIKQTYPKSNRVWRLKFLRDEFRRAPIKDSLMGIPITAAAIDLMACLSPP